jgi:hypothetical protein
MDAFGAVRIRTLKDQCANGHRFETLQHANSVTADWIDFSTTGAFTRRWVKRLLLRLML